MTLVTRRRTGGPVGSRHRQQLNGEFIAALLRDFRHGGPAAIAKVRPACSIKEVARDSCSSTRLGTHRYSGDDSQSGCGTQANTYSDRTRSQGASSDPGEGSLERRLNGRQLYV